MVKTNRKTELFNLLGINSDHAIRASIEVLSASPFINVKAEYYIPETKEIKDKITIEP